MNLDLAGRTRNDSRAITDDFDKTIKDAADALAGLDSAVSRVHRRLEAP